MTYRQYQAVPAVSWDELRRIPNTPWTFPASTREWFHHCREKFEREGRELGEHLKRLKIDRVTSAGCGTARLEYWLSHSGIAVHATDSSEVTVSKLRLVDPPFTVESWNFAAHPEAVKDTVLIFRCDTELSDAEWKGVFSRMQAPVVIFIPDHCGSLIDLLRQWKKHLLGLPQIGWLRDERAMKRLWSGYYRETESIHVGAYQGWVLHR